MRRSQIEQVIFKLKNSIHIRKVAGQFEEAKGVDHALRILEDLVAEDKALKMGLRGQNE